MKKFKYLIGGKFQVKGEVIAFNRDDAEMILLEDLKRNLTNYEVTETSVYEKEES